MHSQLSFLMVCIHKDDPVISEYKKTYATNRLDNHYWDEINEDLESTVRYMISCMIVVAPYTKVGISCFTKNALRIVNDIEMSGTLTKGYYLVKVISTSKLGRSIYVEQIDRISPPYIIQNDRFIAGDS